MSLLKKYQKNSLKNKIIVIVGPTASGKSAFAVRMAKKINPPAGGEIISADSRQVYKGLNLASGKITKKEMAGIPHYCLDLVSPKTIFTADRFKRHAQNAIKDIIKRGKMPIIVGGTGFYIDSALGLNNIPEVPPNWKLRKNLEKKSPKELLKMLKKIDSKRAKTIEPKNKRRLIRAIEIIKTIGRYTPAPTIDRMNDGRKIVWFGIKTKPKELRKKINRRLDKRLKAGMIEEIKKLHADPPAGGGVSWKRLDDLGLEPRWVSRYLRGKISKEEMIQNLQTAIWRYSRRQMTWFRRNKKIRWIKPHQFL